MWTLDISSPCLDSTNQDVQHVRKLLNECLLEYVFTEIDRDLESQRHEKVNT